MRVIAGKARRLALKTVPGMETRPTTDRIKETLFNILQNDLPGCHFLDLFAGSGAIGIEALSRGADSCTFVDMSETSLALVRKTLEGTGLSNKARVVRSDYAAFAAACRDTFDIAFLDPPYSAGLLMPALKAVLPLMSEHGTIVCEHPPETVLDEEAGGFKKLKTYRYGKVLITVYRKGESL